MARANGSLTRAAMAKLEQLVIGNEPPTEASPCETLVGDNDLATKWAGTKTTAIQ